MASNNEDWKKWLATLTTTTSTAPINDNTFYDYYGQNRLPEFWESNKVIDLYEQQRRAQEMSDALKKLQEYQTAQTIASSSVHKYEFDELLKRIRNIEDRIEILLNMLKLILTTQIEKEFKDKDEKPHSELS